MLNPELVVLTAQENISLKSKEDPAGSNKQPYGAMFDEHLKDWQWFNGRKNGFDWCTQFHDAMFVDTYGVETARKMLFRPKSSLAAVVKYSYNYYKTKNAVGKKPMIGGSIFFQNAKGLSHIGIVTGFDKTYVYTIEGNTTSPDDLIHSWYVSAHRYKLTDSYIFGYGYPDFTCGDDPEPAGIYEVGKMYHVVCSEPLMLRSRATTDGAKYGQLTKGAPVCCEEVASDISGNIWIRFGALWCCGRYGREVYIK